MHKSGIAKVGVSNSLSPCFCAICEHFAIFGIGMSTCLNDIRDVNATARYAHLKRGSSHLYFANTFRIVTAIL